MPASGSRDKRREGVVGKEGEEGRGEAGRNERKTNSMKYMYIKKAANKEKETVMAATQRDWNYCSLSRGRCE